MKLLTAIAIISLSILGQASAQAPVEQFKIELTAAELQTVGAGLGKLPFEQVAPIINKLNEQLAAINKAKAEAAKADVDKVDVDKKAPDGH